MDLEQGICFTSILVCALVFLSISIYVFLSKNPVNFWAGEKISVSCWCQAILTILWQAKKAKK